MDAVTWIEGKNLVVTKANSLVEASYTLTLNEQRIILACVAQLDGRKPAPKGGIFVLTADEFRGHFNTDLKITYQVMEEAASRLYERDIRKIDNKTRKRMRWVYLAEYQKGEGSIKLGFSPEITPYLTMLHKSHTSYKLTEVAGLVSVYSIRLYEMLARFQDTGWFIISVDEFRDRLELNEKYSRFSNLKARVIDSAVKELSAKTSIEVNWEPIKKGRNVFRLRFEFKEKTQMFLL
ncbi:MAG: replication initiation protein [Candidatus Thiodiazotropha sp. (ex Lucinoma aequizonata)]|nr:replication initiation protein [Candidatus Thiodiazotropha sp. (ex Lucinoma aequizonata)]MCU7889472.1 replication initiation protein [Candidatus Thiodiazotropha sp. (ex Lucinoma aequizonata)]MCU7896653.1 replication initiation protein [Candidatus Thiodiazotropha sp. (ex Lucinoma aequizonata)]MCU7899306.1 replication initiation protein [Candidatus Thiodiazotropha sp. (ex Lucinoma aequizonata)]MCU7903767.1 replication initiation protein [Candidatus Thiodiazotropha sp. (ex Lucinoma aequizonata)